jgi:hypothetical protein
LIKVSPKSNFVFKPTDNDTCVVTCHFNFIGWKTPVRNLNRFLRDFKRQGIEVYGAEAYLKNPVTVGRKNWIQIKATERNICFQKEALLNIVIRNLPDNYTKIIVCDHDIFFERKDWFQEASKALDYYDFIQPFSTCVWTGLSGEELGRKESFFKVGSASWGHPGFSIGFKRSAFSKSEFYPFCIVGGGDTIIAGSVTGNIKSAKYKFKRFFDDYKILGSNEWFKKVRSQNFLYGYIDGTIYHEYHGSKKDRKYEGRGLILKNIEFENIFINESGLVEFGTKSEKTMKEVYEYLKSRNEDS